VGQLKTQAKELLCDDAGDAEATKRMRHHFTIEPGRSLTLTLAQPVLARNDGYQSWPKHKAFVDGVTRQHLVEAVKAGDHAFNDRIRIHLRSRREIRHWLASWDAHQSGCGLSRAARNDREAARCGRRSLG